jgi:hypothetical protein
MRDTPRYRGPYSLCISYILIIILILNIKAAASDEESNNLITICKGKKVIALGDSLTGGFLTGRTNHPYAIKLFQLNNQSEVVGSGVN